MLYAIVTISVKKIIFVVIPALLLGLFFFFLFQQIVKSRSQRGALQVTSAPESKVYLNDTYLGQTPLCKCEASDMLQTGDYTIKLVPIDKNLSEFQEKVTISEAVLTVVDRKFGKNSLSEGSIISLASLPDKKKVELLVASFPRGATVLLDNNQIGSTPLLSKNATESDHVLKVRKNGYKEKTVRIRTPLGYKLTVAIYLGIDPDASPEPETPPANAPTSATSPTPSPSSAKVVILDTPTGFLRVRESNSVGGTEVGRVGPGEKYPLVSEQSGWFEIKLTNGKTGWISSDYSQKEE